MQLEQYTNEYPIQSNEWWREMYSLTNPTLIPKPNDVEENHIAYNPSGIWTTKSKSGKPCDIMYVRVEPNCSNKKTSHLGKSIVRPYIVCPEDFSRPLEPYYDAEEKMGEDAALTVFSRKLGKEAVEKTWLLSYVKANPYPDRPDQVKDLHTEFYAGSNLNALKHVANGPEGMKDIRIIQDSYSTKLHVYGRPQPERDSGNITHTVIDTIEDLNPETISNAPYIDENLFPIGERKWGGTNDIISVGRGKHLLVAHRAWRTGEDGRGRHYEAVLLGHNTKRKSIVELGILATANLFPAGTVKEDDAVDLDDVVFPGGGYNGTLKYMTFGARDGSIIISGVKKRS